MWKTILDLLLPIKCLGCGKDKNGFICPTCLEKITINKKPPLMGMVAATDYQSPLIKKAIHSYKYGFIKDLAEPLAELMTRKLNSSLFFPKQNCVLAPVPLHPKRLRWRGFNQAELLARVISQKSNLPVITDLLRRIYNTQPQAEITDAQIRKQNIKRAFCLGPAGQNLIKSGLAETTIILIDDVATTGATLEECARALNLLKPKQIWGLVAAR